MANPNRILDLIKDLDVQTVKNLDLSYKNIIIIEDLKNLENVTFLNLSNNQIRKIENLHFMKELRELNLSHNFLRKIENLDNCKLLATLNLSWNQISSWENLPNFCKLNLLNLDNNAFEVLKFPDGLKDLNSLSVAMNRIREICIFPNFNKLEEINLYDNEIEKIPAKIFDNCSKLLILDLSKNKINNLSFLTPLKNLVTLNLAENKITELDPNITIETLENLFLQKNYITETFFLNKMFSNLLTLNISDNSLISTYELKFCEEMQYLYDLDFSGNFDLTEEELQTFSEKYRSLERINGKQYRELASATYELIQELKKEIKEKKYDETMEMDIISKDLEFSELTLKKEEKEEFVKNLEFIKQCKEQEQEIRRRYQTLLGKGKINELNKKISENSLNMSFEITQVKVEDEEKMRKSETKFIIRKSKSKYDGSKSNEFSTINFTSSKPATKEKINNSNILTTTSTLALNKTPKELPELKDVRLKDFNKIAQNTSSSNTKKQTKSMVKSLGKDLFKPIEVLTLDKRRSELKDNLLKYMGVGRNAAGKEPFLVKK